MPNLRLAKSVQENLWKISYLILMLKIKYWYDESNEEKEKGEKITYNLVYGFSKDPMICTYGVF